MRNLIFLIFLSPLLSSILTGQDTDYGPGYQFQLMSNPGLAGAEPDGRLRLSYFNFYPGKSFNLHSFYVSYDSYFQDIHGGAGFYFSDDYLGGIINDLKGGISYAYFLKAGEDLFINAGLSASFYHRGFNFSNALLPDQIDPFGGSILPTGEALPGSSKTVFDVGAGLIFISGKLAGGISMSHLARPDISLNSSADEKLNRKLLLFLSGDYDLKSGSGIKIRPVAFMQLQQDIIQGGPGVVLESPFLSVNTLLITGNGQALDVQGGFSITTGRLVSFYNYRFNIISPYKCIG